MQFTGRFLRYGNSVALTIPTRLREVIPGADPDRKVLIEAFQENGQQVLRVSWPFPDPDNPNDKQKQAHSHAASKGR